MIYPNGLTLWPGGGGRRGGKCPLALPQAYNRDSRIQAYFPE